MGRGISSTKIEQMRQKINDRDYLHAAIYRLALVISNELMDITQDGVKNGRSRKKRK
ncbi:MAG: hypothetical protein FWG66_01835 [Spirochaetes bacterium]|nr:hypothetical protein [Spirochaetota bacterium]